MAFIDLCQGLDFFLFTIHGSLITAFLNPNRTRLAARVRFSSEEEISSIASILAPLPKIWLRFGLVKH
jgi:hypothetical protein